MPFTAAARHLRQLSNDLLESSSKLNITDICFCAQLQLGEVIGGKTSSFDVDAISGRLRPLWLRSSAVRWLVSSADLWSESSWPLRPRASTVTSASPTTALPSWGCWGWPTPWPSREVKTTSTATRLLRWLDPASRRLWCLQVSGEL